MAIKNYKTILYSPNENTSSISVVSDFLKDNGIEETEDQIFEKIEKDENSFAVIVRKAVIDFFDKKITEKELIPMLAEKLNIQKNNSKKLVEGIKIKLLPMIKQVEILEDRKEKSNTILNTEKSLPLKKIPVQPITPVTKTTNRGPDSYREPIE